MLKESFRDWYRGTNRSRAEERLRSLEDTISNDYLPEFKELLHTLGNWRELVIDYQDGKAEIYVDGESLICKLIYQDTILERSYFGSDPEHEGTLNLRSVSYKVDNPGDHKHSYEWQAASGKYPNQYEIDRWLELDYNPNPNPDGGYSSWLQLPDGRIFVADYTNEDAPPGKAYLKGYYLRPDELNLGS